MYILPELPYPPASLSPVLGELTVRTHHEKHHARYVHVTNELLQKKGAPERPLEQVIVEAQEQRDAKLFNNAAQAWNHAFFWECMTPAGGKPSVELSRAIAADCGGLEGLREQFVSEGVAHFGSGWVWLTCKDRRFTVVTTHDAGLPQTGGAAVPVLVCDVWEHAYYLDYRNERERFLRSWFEGVVNWAFVEAQYEAAMRGKHGYRYPPPVR